MKFGSQIKNKSVPEWNCFNLDYNHLKLKVKSITQLSANAQSSDDLYKEIIEQIDIINLFLNSKIGEIKRRLTFIQDNFITNPIEINKISNDLQKLSRFIVVQKTALRKLLKKFTKYSNDNGNLNSRINNYMIENNQSFIHINLNNLYLKLALVYNSIRNDGSTNSSLQSTLNEGENFNYQALKNGNYTKKFLIHYDNLQEFKFFLLSNFNLIDENLNSKQNETTYHKLDESNHSNSIYLNEMNIDESNKSSVILQNDQNDQSIVLNDLNNVEKNLLLSTIGGFKKIAYILLNDDDFYKTFLKSLLQNEPFEKFYSDNESKFKSLDSNGKNLIEWVYQKNLKPLIKYKFNETNFINLFEEDQSNDEFKCWINLKSNIKINELNLDSIDQLHSESTTNTLNFPYALLEVSWNFSNNSTTLTNLFHNHLIYNIDDDFDLLKFANYKFHKQANSPSWIQLFEKKIDIRKNPPNLKKLRRKSRSLNSFNNTSNGNESSSSESNIQFRYWNEFDNGSDLENQDDGFLIDVDSNNEFGIWNLNLIDWFYKISNNFNNFLIMNIPWFNNEDQLIDDTNQYNYGSFNDYEALNNSEELKIFQQSTFLSSISLLTSLISLILCAISLGITSSIFNNYDDFDLNPLITGILLITMTLSLFLAVLSICLIMNCDSKPLFSLIFIWSVFFGVTIFIIGSIGSIFGI